MAGTAGSKGQGMKHQCPPLPASFVKFLNPYWQGQSVEQSRKMWAAHLRRVDRLRPTPRNTRGQRFSEGR